MMDTELVNTLVYDYMLTVNPKIAEKFKKKTNLTQQLPPGSPLAIADVVKHFNDTSNTDKKRKVEDEESTVKKAQKVENSANDEAMDTECHAGEQIDGEAENVKDKTVVNKSEPKDFVKYRKKIFIRNVAKESVFGDFQEKVEKFGKVTEFTNSGRGFCFLKFSTAEAANACIAALNNTEIAGKTVQMNIAREETKFGVTKKGVAKGDKGCKLFVHGVKQETDNDKIKEIFDKYGKVTDSFNPGKGFAFVTFSTPEEADAAVEALNGKEVFGNIISVNVSKPKEKPEKEGGKAGKDKKKAAKDSVRLFVNNVSEKTSQDDLKTAFAGHGTVTDAYNPGKGFAFVNFATADEAQAAIEALNGQEVCGQVIECNIAKFKKTVQKGRAKS